MYMEVITMCSMHRSQVYIEEEQIQRLKLEAERRRLAVSELIRRAIDAFLKRHEQNVDWDDDPITKLVGKMKASVTDASLEHDHYLYRTEKKKR